MPSVIPHLLLPAILVALWRDYHLKRKDKKKFPLHYVLIAGIGGALPDIDVLAYVLISPFGFEYSEIHRNLTHSLVFPLFFVLFGFLLYRKHIKLVSKHHLNLGIACWILAFGTLTHILLDVVFAGTNMPLFAPFNYSRFGLDLFSLLSEPWKDLVFGILDAGSLIIWISYLEIRHKLSDFV